MFLSSGLSSYVLSSSAFYSSVLSSLLLSLSVFPDVHKPTTAHMLLPLAILDAHRSACLAYPQRKAIDSDLCGVRLGLCLTMCFSRWS